LEKLRESYNNCLKRLKRYLEENSKLVVNSIFLKNNQARLIYKRKRKRRKETQANLKERFVSKKLMGVIGWNSQLNTKMCMRSSNVNVCQNCGLAGSGGAWELVPSVLHVPALWQRALPPRLGHRHSPAQSSA